MKKRDNKSLNKIKEGLISAFEKTKFKSFKISLVCADPKDKEMDRGLDTLMNEMLNDIDIPKRGKKYEKSDFLFSVDHWFAIKGQGTVMTGTVLKGSVGIGDTIEVASLKQEKKVKSMQMFRKPIDIAKKGDRVGIWVSKLDPKDLERGLVWAPGKSNQFTIALAQVQRIRHFKGEVLANMKYHFTIGHQTVLGTCTFFYNIPEENKLDEEDKDEESKFGFFGTVTESVKKEVEFVYNTIHLYSNCLPRKATKPGLPPKPEILPMQAKVYALIFFEAPIIWAPINSIFIGSKLDTEIEKNEWRLAFNGHILETYSAENEEFKKLIKITKDKFKEGIVDKVVDNRNIIVRNLLNKETPVSPFVNMKVIIVETGEIGKITGAFGKSGKFKARFDNDLQNTEELKNKVVRMPFKKLLYDTTHKMIQTI